MHRSRWWLAALAAALITVVAVPAASADTYSVFSCKGPTGVPNTALGWAPNPPPTGVGQAINACPSGGPLTALVDVDPVGTASATWGFAAPTDTRIVRFAAQRHTTGVTGGPPRQPNDVQYVLTTDQGTLENCVVSDTSSCVADLTAPIDKQGLDAGFVRIRVLCTNTGLSCPRALRADFDTILVGLKDAFAPTVSGVQVVDNGDRSGVLSVRFNAADRGGGVYRAVIFVDGKVIGFKPLGGTDCTDANPADGDPYQFLAPVPCPPSVTGAVASINSRALGAGPHSIEISVEDAAGNSTSVYGPIQFPRVNAETAPSSPAAIQRIIHGHLRAWFVKTHTRAFTNTFGNRTVIRGFLRDSRGHGIQGARIDVYHLRSVGKHKRLLKTGLKTRAGGALTLILPLDLDTRRIELAFRALRPGRITSRQILHLTVLRHGRVYVRPTGRRA